MRIDELFPQEVIDEDIRKTLGDVGKAGLAGLMGAAVLATPSNKKYDDANTDNSQFAQEVKVLAQTMWGEARNLGTEGMNAVGHVIKNRAEVNAPRFGEGIKGVALKRKQFSCWNPSDPNREKIAEMRKIEFYFKTKQPPPGEESFEDWEKKFKSSPQFGEYRAWLEAYDLAKKILSNKSYDTTKGALFYHTKGTHPYWAQGIKPITADSSHVFYKTVKQAN